MTIAGMVGSMLTATERAIVSFSRSFGSPPDQAARQEWHLRQARFILLWSYWDGTAYEDLIEWATYKRDHGLVEDIRLFESHVRRVVDFYHTHVYSGELAEDGLRLPGGLPNAIPLAQETDPTLAAAIGQLWQWWGFVDVAPLAVLYASTVGNCPVEIFDDVRARKVRVNLVWPGYISDIELSPAGDVWAIAKEYEVFDPTANKGAGEVYLYRREMDRQYFRTYKNGNPHDYDGFGAVRPNPYGFVPVVWYRGVINGSAWGEPIIHGSQTMLDLMNSLYTSMYGNLRTFMDSPIFVAGRTRPGHIAEQIAAGQVAEDALDPLEYEPADYDYGEERVPTANLRIVQVAEGSQMLTTKVDVGQVRMVLRDLINGIEAQFPEVKFWNEIRGMPALTKPGVESAMGDVVGRLRRYASQFDRQTKKLHQMGVAIAGMRYNDGSWAEFARLAGEPLSQEHEKFAPYGLNSYSEGRLKHIIMPRDLVKESEPERLAIARDLIDIGVPMDVAWKRAGFSDAEIEAWVSSGRAVDPTKIMTAQNSNVLEDILGEIDRNPGPIVPEQGPTA